MANATAESAPSPMPAATNDSDNAARKALVRRDARIFTSWWNWLALVIVVAVWFVAPMMVNNEWARVLSFAGIIAVAALGLNLLTGYAGQASLGSAAFMAIGAFIATYMGRAVDDRVPGLGQPFTVYLVVAIIAGGVVGFVVGLPALRLRGNYLVVVTLGLVFITVWVIDLITRKNGVTVSVAQPPNTAEFLGIDWGNAFNFFGMREPAYNGEFRYHGLMYLNWLFVGIVALLVKNVVRSRPGRALQAIRERDVAAEVVGVSLFRYKVGAFVMSSAIGACAGALYGLHVANLKPTQEAAFGNSIGLGMSILVLTVIIVGGIGSVYGTVVGALIIGSLPEVIGLFSDKLPFIAGPGESGLSAAVFTAMLSAVLLVGTLVIEPFGFAGTMRKIKVHYLQRKTAARHDDAELEVTSSSQP